MNYFPQIFEEPETITLTKGQLKNVIKEAVSEALEAQKPGLTKEDIMKEPNRTKRLQLIRENMHLFK